jgi:hypothetical protein
MLHLIVASCQLLVASKCQGFPWQLPITNWQLSYETTNCTAGVIVPLMTTFLK